MLLHAPRRLRLTILALAASLAASFAAGAAADQLNVYTARHYDGDEALFQRFTERTGIEVRVLQASSDQLIQRIRREGSASPADILLTVDAGRLWRAEQADILVPARSERLEERIPAHLRHGEGLWYGFSIRARVIFYNPERVDATAIARYEDLADPRFEGQICLRSSSNIYNQSLLASLLVEHGTEATLEWTRGLMDNLARPPQGGDTDQIRGVAAGECDIGIANHYYYLRLAQSSDPDDRAVAERVEILFPNQADRGTHINVGGAGIVRDAPHEENALRFLEYLASDEAQRLFAAGNFEYPVVEGVAPVAELEALGSFEADELAVERLGRNNAEALRIADRAGWR